MAASLTSTLVSGLAIAVVSVTLGAGLASAQEKAPPAAGDRKVVWDGDRVFPKSFGHMEPKDENLFQPQTDEVHQGKVALECVINATVQEGDQAVAQGGWNWHGWWPPDSGDDLTPFTHFVFWIKVEKGKKIDRLEVGLESSTPRERSPRLDVARYCQTALDGQWHEIAIPVADLVVDGAKFNPKKVWELRIKVLADPAQVPCAVYFDDLAYERRTPKPANP